MSGDRFGAAADFPPETDPRFDPVFPPDDEPAGLYIHFPFCHSRCDYCGFVSGPHSEDRERAYIDALLGELDLIATGAASSTMPVTEPVVDTIYVGGGTPSLLDPDSLERVLGTCRSTFTIGDSPEITIEMNPGTADPAKLAAFRDLGVTRLSLGIQSLDDRELRRMGRSHTAADAVRSVEWARKSGFTTVSADLMAGYPGRTVASIQDDLAGVLSLGPDHLSAYLLEVKEGTRLADAVERGECPRPDDDEAAAMYEAICETAGAAGYEQYEISNFALPGHESRHNLKYWTDRIFIGVGAAAHGMTGRVRYANTSDRAAYEATIRRGSPPRDWIAEMTPLMRFKDALIMGARLVAGLDLERLGQRYHIDAARFIELTVGDLSQSGLFEFTARRFRLTPRGRLLSNIVFGRWL